VAKHQSRDIHYGFQAPVQYTPAAILTRTDRCCFQIQFRGVRKNVLESARARADEALSDRRTFGLNAAQWKAFLAALDAPPRRLPRLEALLSEPGFFEAGRKQ
jgi:uncharacterized protein (DUF1778 family)